MAKDSLGLSIDKCYKQKQKVSTLTGKCNKEKEILSALERDILQRMQKEGLETSGGKLAKITIQDKTFPDVFDWDKFYKYIKKNDAWDMLQKRVSSVAYKARLDDKVKVPGVKKFTKHSLLMRKK